PPPPGRLVMQPALQPRELASLVDADFIMPLNQVAPGPAPEAMAAAQTTRTAQSNLSGAVRRNAEQAARFDQRVKCPAPPQPNANIQQQTPAVTGTTPAWAQVSIHPAPEALLT